MKVVVIPATYNEKGNIEKLISILQEEVFPKIKDYDMYVLVADDNSPDGTADVVRELGKKWKNVGVNVGERKGLGAAYIRVMTYAIEKMSADIVLEMDADLSHDPHEIPNFLRKLSQGYDMVIGTRYSDGGSMPQNWPIHRKAFSVLGNLLVRCITFRFSIHDWTGGFRAIKKDLFLKEKEKVSPYQGYTFQVAFLYKAILDGYKIAEVPIHFADRKLGRSKIAPLEYIVNLLYYVISERIYELKRVIKFLIVGGSGFIFQVLIQETAIAIGLAGAIAKTVAPIINVVDLKSFAHATGSGFGAEGAILSNFLLNNVWTFDDTKKIKENASFFAKLAKFNFTSLASIFIQFSAVWMAEKFYGSKLILLSFTLPTRIVVLFPTIIFLVIPLNYFIYSRLIWKTQYLKNGTPKKA